MLIKRAPVENTINAAMAMTAIRVPREVLVSVAIIQISVPIYIIYIR